MTDQPIDSGVWGEPADTPELTGDHARELLEANRKLQNEILWRSEAERSIQANETRFRQLFENMSSGVIIFEKFCISDEDTRLVVKEINAAAERIESTRRDEVVGRFIYEAFPYLHDTPLAIALERVMAGGDPERVAEAAYNMPSGTRWRECYAYQLPSEEVILVCDDITEKHEFEEKMAEMNRQLQEASRQAGMAEIASGVLHNIGNALNSVNVALSTAQNQGRRIPVAELSKAIEILEEKKESFTEYVQSDPKGQRFIPFISKVAEMVAARQEGIKSELKRLHDGVEHIANIVAMQQSYAKGRSMTEILDAHDLVSDALQLNAETLRAGSVSVKFPAADGDVRVNVTRHKFLEVLVNLIRNAKQAMDKVAEGQRQLTICVNRGTTGVVIQVHDTGIGIDEANLTRIFAHGFSTRKEGHGFGLHSSALAVKNMNGTLEATSDGPGTGATFVLTLPPAVD